MRLESVHITLKFIGEVSLETVEKIRLALGSLPAFPPIALGFAGLGFFPSARRPRVFWAGVEADPQLAGWPARSKPSSNLWAFPPKSAIFIPISRWRALTLRKALRRSPPRWKLSERPSSAAKPSASFICIAAC